MILNVFLFSLKGYSETLIQLQKNYIKQSVFKVHYSFSNILLAGNGFIWHTHLTHPQREVFTQKISFNLSPPKNNNNNINNTNNNNNNNDNNNNNNFSNKNIFLTRLK